MTDQWVRVYEGLVPQARIAEGLLKDRGVPATVVAKSEGYLGAASLGAVTTESVLVPPDRAEDALAILRDEPAAFEAEDGTS